MPKIRLCIIGGGSPYMTSMFGTLARCGRTGDLLKRVVTNFSNAAKLMKKQKK